MTRRAWLAIFLLAALAAACSPTTATRRAETMDDTQDLVLSAPNPADGARFDLTSRPSREEVGLTPGAETLVVGKSTAPPFTTTLVTDAGEVSVLARDVIIDSGPSAGPVTHMVVQLVLVPRAEREAELRLQAPVLGLDVAKIDTFFDEAAEAHAAGATDTVSTLLRGGTTGGGSIEVVVRYNPKDDMVFENLQVTWLD